MFLRLGSLLPAVVVVFAAACGGENECGGSGDLTVNGVRVEFGGVCGPCGDGVVICGEGGGAVCLDASEPSSECGGCGIDPGVVGGSCGSCGGVFACDGDTMVCSNDGVQNACGGCSVLAVTLGVLCEAAGPSGEENGITSCTGLDEVSCVPLGANGCGGSSVLAGLPASPCGTCNQGVWVCDGEDAVTCNDPERGANACGGCSPLEGAPDTACDACGASWACSEDGESVFCDAAEPNLCGGCSDLALDPGSRCGDGGTSFCASPETIECGPVGGNACGGSSTLEGAVGSVCGACSDGVFICGGPDRLVCRGASQLNVCGGCGFVSGMPGESCAPLGTWQCVGTELICAFREGANVCGGDSELEGAPGDPCGACDLGRLACDGFDALTCVGGEEERALSWPDGDGDGFGDADGESVVDCALEGRVRNADDCNDEDAAFAPGADEVCDGLDGDCDGRIDESAGDGQDFFVDADGDGFGNPARPVRGCEGADMIPGSGLSALGTDCDDSSTEFNPDALETDCADPRDLNCDGETLFVDVDGDGFAACVESCDDDPLRNPGVTERCDTVDNDCDGATDEGPLAGAPRWFPDGDGDLLGDDTAPIFACAPPANHVAVGGDCNDQDGSVFAGAPEFCDAVDDDCDGSVDEEPVDGVPTFRDDDGDTFGTDGSEIVACALATGFVLRGGDCNDGNDAVHPFAVDRPISEVCDFVDNDCDALIDGPSSATPTTWFVDADRDGFGGSDALSACEPFLPEAAPAGRIVQGGDCNDENPLINPSRDEIVGDGTDQNCDTRELCYADDDRDGFGDISLRTVLSADLVCRREDGEATEDRVSDCNDALASVNPNAAEVVGDNVDQNCDGEELCYFDEDGDGFVPPGRAEIIAGFCSDGSGSQRATNAAPQTDCAPADPEAFPGAPDSLITPKDENCDGFRGDEAQTTFLSPSGALTFDGPCTRAQPCNTLDLAFGETIFSEVAATAGSYLPPIRMQGGSTMASVVVGGFSADFSSTVGRSTFGGALLDSDMHLENVVLGGGSPGSSGFPFQTVAALSIIANGTYELVSTELRPGVISDAFFGPGGTAYAALIHNGSATVRFDADSRIVLGRGGAGQGATGEGGASVGIGSFSPNIFIEDAASLFDFSEAAGGVSSGVCTQSFPLRGLRCDPARAGLPGRVEALYFDLPDGPQQNSFVSGGVLKSYTRQSFVAESREDMAERCSPGRPVFLRSDAEEAALAPWLLWTGGGNGSVRLGTFDDDHDGVFTEPAGTLASYTPWPSGEPAPQTNDRCVVTDGVNFFTRWCSGSARAAAICERSTESCIAQGAPGCSVGLACRSDAFSTPVCVPDTTFTDGPDRAGGFPPGSNLLAAGGTTYEIFRVSESPVAALDLCTRWGGRLLEIGDASEQLSIGQLMAASGETFSWTGAQNATPDDVFRDTADAIVSHLPWGVGEPRGEGAGACAVLNYAGSVASAPADTTVSSRSWSNGEAYDNTLDFVCEYEVQGF